MTRITRAVLTFVVIVGGFLAFFPVVPPGVAALDVSFQDDLVTAISAPTALAFTPGGRMVATTQLGQLRVYTGGALLATPALDLGARGDLCSNSERGLLGIAAGDVGALLLPAAARPGVIGVAGRLGTGTQPAPPLADAGAAMAGAARLEPDGAATSPLLSGGLFGCGVATPIPYPAFLALLGATLTASVPLGALAGIIFDGPRQALAFAPGLRRWTLAEIAALLPPLRGPFRRLNAAVVIIGEILLVLAAWR